MNAMDAIFSRRSIRSYTGEMPSDEELNLILKAVYASPVGMGRYDSLHVTVVKSKNFLARLEAAAGAQMGKADVHPLYGAPLLLIFSSVFPGIPTDNSSYSNCAILSENAALAAAALGLGACHIWGAIRALNKEPQLLAELNLPEGFLPCCALALGKTEETYERRSIQENRIMTNTME